MRVRRLVLLVFLFWAVPAICDANDASPRAILNLLNALRLDAQNVYTISPKDRIELRQIDVMLAFEEGRIALFQPFEGRVTGFVFSGLGHAIALPRDPGEKQQMARFLGAPILDQQFVSAYVRFTDDTSQDLLGQLQHAGLQPSTDSSFVGLWQTQLQRLNPSHSMRILFEKFSSAPRHFFHAGIDGVVTGPFDVLVDDMRPENLLIGQGRSVNHVDYYDVWSSYELPGYSPPSAPFDALRYRIDTTIRPDNSLEGDTTVEFKALSGGNRLLFVQLARALKVESVTFGTGEPLSFFQNEGLTEEQLHTRGEDTLVVFLSKPPEKGETFTVRFRYRGDVIESAGNGVLFVGARESWYPHFGDPAEFAFYDMTLHWPKRLRLVATGDKIDEHDDGDFRVGHWKTDLPIPQAGFNLGEYAVASVSSGGRTVDVYANHQLEEAISARISRSGPSPSLPPFVRISPEGASAMHVETLPPPPPSPATVLKQLAREIDSSIHFYEQYNGPFPFKHLGVSQIPGSFGQGWPGLLYVSTFSFLTPEAQERAGLNLAGRELFSEIVPFHEVVHQWWGSVVGWPSYRDQWINEAIAAYLSLLFADSQKSSEHTLTAQLDRYRKRLVTRLPNEDTAPADAGPPVMGSRLTSSKSADAYHEVVYSKGAWIMHMLREMLRQPNPRNPDARFITLLQTLVTKYARKPLSTPEFQREVEAVMTPKMDLEGGHSIDWFFDEYVRGTGIPHYTVKFTSHHTEKGFQIRGKLMQSGVPRSFIAPVPLYGSTGSGHSTFLGVVIASGEETSFSFTTPNETHKVLVDPHMTLLCIPE